MGVVVVFPRALVVVLFDAVVVNNVELFGVVVGVGWVEGLKVVVVGRVELFDVRVLQRRQTFFAFETI